MPPVNHSCDRYNRPFRRTTSVAAQTRGRAWKPCLPFSGVSRPMSVPVASYTSIEDDDAGRELARRPPCHYRLST